MQGPESSLPKLTCTAQVLRKGSRLEPRAEALLRDKERSLDKHSVPGNQGEVDRDEYC